ncbi:MAG: ATP-binding protein [Saprospiraceae bacterium]
MAKFAFNIFKNPTPRQVAILIAITGSLMVVLLVLALMVAGLLTITDSGLLILAVGVAVFAYFISYYFLREYVYRKIKVIYKRIREHKLRPDEKKRVFKPELVFEQVEKEVEEWAEQQQKEIEQLRAWQEYRRKFLGDISHELKTPIFNIQGYLETLLDGGLEDESINQRYIKRAAKNVERLNTIIEDLEVISRLESGELPLDIRTFDIKELTQEVFEDLEFKASQKNIKLGFKQAADQSFKVKADREYVRQVLTNLINNSIKYGSEKGHTRVGFYDMDRAVLIEVADNGIGIAREHLPHLFDRFYRVDKSRSRDQGGSGLGLSIVKHIIEAHQQTINVRSTVGVGTTFGFTLDKA